MRIRKRGQLVAPVAATPPPPQAISYKYQSVVASPPRGKRSGWWEAGSNGIAQQAECSNMQMEVQQRLRPADDHHAAASHPSRSDAAEAPLEEAETEWNRRLSDAEVKGEESGSTKDDDVATDKSRGRQSSPTKKRRIEHDSRVEEPAPMTDAELLNVMELVLGVRQRLLASELSSSEQSTPPENSSKPAAPPPPPENSKDALISSIFYVFDTYGENGLSASEVVKSMIDRRLPGLKEGGARHTVQVANVLRSSSSFISLGDKKYILCAAVNGNAGRSRSTGQHQQQQAPQTRAAPAAGGDDDSSEKELIKTAKRRPSNSKATATPMRSANGKKVQVEKPVLPMALESSSAQGPGPDEAVSGVAGAVRVARRRGPSSSQKGKGPTQCKRYDGRGWQCSRLTEPGYSLCVHHQDLINKRAAKLKEQQTMSRLLESVQRKAKSQQQGPAQVGRAPARSDPGGKDSSPDPSPSHNPAASPVGVAGPVQKRKMLSLLAINK